MPTSDHRVSDRSQAPSAKNSSAEVSDAQLLDAFIERRDESSFRELLARHGPMVMGVCRRVIGDEHVAEDAFQATFMVLTRKAPGIEPKEALANWLFGVAYRTARRSRASTVRVRAREKQVEALPEASSFSDNFPSEVVAVVDQELSQLPEKYRLPMVMCELEGRPRRVVAEHLNLPEGTLSSRLAAGRKMLAERLSRRGYQCTTPALAGFLCNATDPVPPPLAQATTISALQVRPSRPRRWPWWAWLMAGSVSLILIASVTVAIFYRFGTDEQPAQGAEIGELQGNWDAEAMEFGGLKAPDDLLRQANVRFRVEGQRFELVFGKRVTVGKIRAFPEHANWFDLEPDPPGINEMPCALFERRGNKLHLAFGAQRPTSLRTTPDNPRELGVVMVRSP